MLRDAGVEVKTFIPSNDEIVGVAARIKTAAQVTYSWTMRRRIAAEIAGFKPSIVHVHNFFPTVTPSVYDAARDAGCKVVQTIHNYRLICPTGTLFRDGHVCHDCVGKGIAWPGILHGCYRDSHAGTAAVATMLTINRLRGAWSERVDRFLMLTAFARDFFAEHAGIPLHKMRVKPNAVQDPGVGDGGGGYALYAGRLSEEKGIRTLLEAANQGLAIPLRIAGSGPLEKEVRSAHAQGKVEYLGPQSQEQIRSLMQRAALLLTPSQWYEGLPMVIPEAYGTGLPIIASQVGSLASLIIPEQTGLLVEPGNAKSLAEATRRLVDTPALLAKLRAGARKAYESDYRPETNMALLTAIYDELLTEN